MYGTFHKLFGSKRAPAMGSQHRVSVRPGLNPLDPYASEVEPSKMKSKAAKATDSPLLRLAGPTPPSAPSDVRRTRSVNDSSGSRPVTPVSDNGGGGGAYMRVSVNGNAPAPSTEGAQASVPGAVVVKDGSKPAAADEPLDEDTAILTIKSAVFLRSFWPKELLFWLLNLTTVGLVSLFCRWYPSLLTKTRYVKVDSRDPTAEYVLVTSLDDIETVEPIMALDLSDLTLGWQPAGIVARAARKKGGSGWGMHSPRVFTWRHERFWYHSERGVWTRRQFDVKRQHEEVHRMAVERVEETLDDDKSLDASFARALTYGDNQLDVNAKPFPVLCLDEALKPFFAFQLFSIAIWLGQGYLIYMYVVIALSIIAIIQGAYAEYQNLKALERLAKAEGVVNKIRLVREDYTGAAALTVEPVTTSSLQPGDVIHVTTNMILPCDALMLTGTAVMSEAMLTGESAPVVKASLPLDTPHNLFKPDSDKDGKYMLFSGTKVLQAKCPNAPPVPLEELEEGFRCLWEYPPSPSTLTEMPVMAMVVRTAFATSRGKLVRAILFPKPAVFNFEAQTFMFMRVLLVALACGIMMQVSIYMRNGVGWWKTTLDALNLVTVAVPPALPLALSIGTSVALARLKSMGIFCSDATKISAAGRVNCLCFDKTGTLTTDGLTLKGVHYVNRTEASRSLGDQLITEFINIHSRGLGEVLQRKKSTTLASDEDHQLMLSYVMAACHSISVLDQTDDATALIIRLNAEIIHDPSLPEHRQSESIQFFEERNGSFTMEEVMIDPEKEESIYVKFGREADTAVEATAVDVANTDAVIPLLDLPTTTYTEHGQETVQHLVGDTLDIQMFQQSGWRYCVRPSAPPNFAELFKAGMSMDQINNLFRDGAFDAFNIWRHRLLPSYVETVMLPPKPLKGSRHASALAILRRFDFDSDLRRMGAIIRTLPHPDHSRGHSDRGNHFLLVKGAPEGLTDICNKETIPHDLDQQLKRLTLAGYRVLACGTRSLEHLSEASMLKSSREDLEVELNFAGLLVMENSLKEETTEYLRQYSRAGFRQMMVTGDNPLTALAVAKMAGPAFLCSWRRSVLIDVVGLGGGGAGEKDRDRSQLGGGQQQGQGQTKGVSTSGSAGGNGKSSAVTGSNGNSARVCVCDVLDPTLRWDLVTFLKANLPPDKLLLPPADEGVALERPGLTSQRPPPLADVDFICTGRAFGSLLATHNTLREDRPADGERWTNFEAVLLRCNVFARMSPGNKQELMRSLQDLQFVVCMTGDGANDSGALKAADIGISIASAKSVIPPSDEHKEEDDNPENAQISTEISTSEAAVIAAPSIAAPFATGLHHIGAVSIVVTEGRGTLATSFTMFKYMFLYGIVQFVGVLLLYYNLLELSPMQYLYADLFVVLPFVTFMPSMEALSRLKRGKPETNLVSFSVFRSIIGHSFLIVAFQAIQQWMLVHEPWYHPPDRSAPDFNKEKSTETSSKFLFSNFQYLFLALSMCQTYGLFRRSLWTNPVLSVLVVTELTMACIIVLVDWGFFDRFFLLTGRELPFSYRLKILGLGLLSGFCHVFYERYCVPHKSLDEDPVAVEAPRTIVVRTGEYSVQRDGDQGDGWGGGGGEEEDGEERESRLSRLWNTQPTILPKLFHKTPLYHLGALSVG